MTERHTSQARHPAGVPRPRSGTSGVRRNLFQSHLTRRPTTGSSGSAESLRLGGEGGGGVAREEPQSESQSGEIVVRDKNGDVELGDPPTPPMDDSDDGALDARQENEKERQRLADAVKNHQINRNSVPAQPEELLEAVRASLRAKVAALAEDNWMYEPEDTPRLQ